MADAYDLYASFADIVFFDYNGKTARWQSSSLLNFLLNTFTHPPLSLCLLPPYF